MKDVIAEVVAERMKQDARFGEQNHPDSTEHSRDWWREFGTTSHDARVFCDCATKIGVLSWFDILLEEFCEAVEEIDTVKLRAELIQVAAVAVAWAQSIDRRMAKQPESAADDA